MQIFTNIADLWKRTEPVGARKVLVPTMGALHRGHIELIRVARAAAGVDGEVMVSIFVNPLQFAPGGDYEKYPRPETTDEAVCREAGVDLIFRPAPGEMYADDPSVFVEETKLSRRLCGASRPGHFRGVCTVVTKLFHLLRPDCAVFGEKDFQQLAIIRRMVRDLDFRTDIIGVPTVREEDGLAASSRNQYLSSVEREQAAVLYRALVSARESVQAGTTSVATIVRSARETIEQAPLARVDYVELVNADTLEPIDEANANALLAIAVFFGQTRLIDNLRL
ncbi:MAG: pantoate--beta-alanine ligase [Verrucomicrobiota bacterium]|nr:pantoate--beta-alanine ligase [Verrucomicrobiota bacterium]